MDGIYMDNPELVEEFPREYERTQFEKIKVAAKRAKDLHNSQRAALVDSNRTAPYVALEELSSGMIKIVYREEEIIPMITGEAEEAEEED